LKIIRENNSCIDSSADDFVFNIPIELTSSRYFLGYIARDRTAKDVEQLFKYR